MGYELAERLGKHDPQLEAHFKAVADVIAVRDAMNLPKDPSRWKPPAKEPELAKKYLERIALGFLFYQQRLNELKSMIPHKRDITDPEVLKALVNQEKITPEVFESLVNTRVKQWNTEHQRRENRKMADKGDAIDRAAKSETARQNMTKGGMICTCEDWNRDGDFGVVIGDTIVSANYGPYDKCTAYAKSLSTCFK